MSTMDRTTLAGLADAGVAFADGLVGWMRQYPDEADKSRLLHVDDILLRKRRLSRVRAALEHRASVGLFGESQCGKSMLVSRFGQALGVATDAEGNLLIRGVPGEESGSNAAGISFTRYLDPAASQESTGIACRFTTRELDEIGQDRFLLELMSISELLTSLALGWKSSQAEQDVDLELVEEVLSRTLKMLRREECLEDDPDELMVELLEAWEYLRHEPGSPLSNTKLYHLLDNGDAGWDEFVRECVKTGRRPRLSAAGPNGGQAPIDQLVALLWPRFDSLTDVWRKLFLARWEFRSSDSVTVHKTDACKQWNEDTLRRQSIIAVEWIRLLDPDPEDSDAMLRASLKVEVQGTGGHSGERDGRFVRIADLVAMTRSIVLPLQPADADARLTAAFDVIDFPGARADEKSNRGVDAFLRGKLNRLFVGSTNAYDTNVLCLVAAADGNMEAAPVVREAIDAWRASKSHGDQVDKPMVLAITKADKLWEGQRDPSQGAKARLERIRGDYVSSASDRKDWMTEGGPGGREFQRVHWVHNPDFAGDVFCDEDRARARFGEPTELFTKHSSGWRGSLDALLASDGSDITRLLDSVSELAKESARTRGLSSMLVGQVDGLHACLAEVYKPGGNIDARERAEADARTHVSALRMGHKHYALANLLQMVSWSPRRLESVIRETLLEATEHAMGVVEFDALYARLLRAYRKEIDREIGQNPQWFVGLGDETVRAQLQGRVMRLPEWEDFREAVRRAVEPRLQVSAQQMNSVAIASGIRMVWSRQMVWLGSPPTPRRDGRDLQAPLEIDLRFDSKATLDILRHWESRLPEVYAGMDGQDQSGQPHNAHLKTLIAPLRETVSATRDHITSVAGGDDYWGGELDRIEGLFTRLQEPETESEDER